MEVEKTAEWTTKLGDAAMAVADTKEIGFILIVVPKDGSVPVLYGHALPKERLVSAMVFMAEQIVLRKDDVIDLNGEDN